MILASWKIETDVRPPKRWMWVRVHDSVGSLRKSAYRYGREPVGTLDRAHACVQPCWVVFHDDAPEVPIYPESGFAGVIRFAQDQMYTEVIHHELVHAAMQVYRMNIVRGAVFGPDEQGMEREEDLAYILGELGADMGRGLREHCDFGDWGR